MKITLQCKISQIRKINEELRPRGFFPYKVSTTNSVVETQLVALWAYDVNHRSYVRILLHD